MAEILLVEDDPRLRTIAEKVLVRAGHHLTVAVDGQAAVEQALAEPHEIVLMDLSLPVMDGLEATRRIKAALPDLPVVAVTAHAMVGDRERALAAGCDGFLSKPYTIPELLECVSGAIRSE
jgi:CheY-like chemotaxis protein